MKNDPLFKACMRPPLLFGVPMIPFIALAMPSALLVLTVSFWFLLIFILAHQAMVLKTKQDELYFDLVVVRVITYFMVYKNKRLTGDTVAFMAATTAEQSVKVRDAH